MGMKSEHCRKCEYGYRFTCGDYCWFIGCKYPPFRGRHVAEIDKCPKEQEPQTEKGGVSDA